MSSEDRNLGKMPVPKSSRPKSDGVQINKPNVVKANAKKNGVQGSQKPVETKGKPNYWSSKAANPSTDCGHKTDAEKHDAVIKKYSEEPLNFFQPDMAEVTSAVEMDKDPKSIVEGSNRAVQTAVATHKKTLDPEYASSDRQYPQKNGFEAPKLPPRLMKNADAVKRGSIDEVSQSAGNSVRLDYKNPSKSNGTPLEPKQPLFARSPSQNGKFGSASRSVPPRFNQSDSKGENVVLAKPHNGSSPHSGFAKGSSGPQQFVGKGGQRKNKNGKKINGQNAYSGDGMKYPGRLNAQPGKQMLVNPQYKTVPPPGYYNNHEAFIGQNLIAAEPQMMRSPGIQPQMMSPMGGGQPQPNSGGMTQPQMVNQGCPIMMNPMPYGDDQCTMALFPGGFVANQWIDMGGHSESQQVLVQFNGEVVPLTMANCMPYVVPYTPGLPNTGVPMLIPAVGPPLRNDMDGQSGMNGGMAYPGGNVPNQADPKVHSFGNMNQMSQNDNGAHPAILWNPTETVSHSVSSHVGPIPACSETHDRFALSQLERSWENGKSAHHEQRGSLSYGSAPKIQLGNPQIVYRSDGSPDTPNPNVGQNHASVPEVSSLTLSDRPTLANSPATPLSSVGSTDCGNSTKGTPGNSGTPGDPGNDCPGAPCTPSSSNTFPSTPTDSWDGTPGAWDQTSGTSTATGEDSNCNVTPTVSKRNPSMANMISVTTLENMHRMSSANGKRVPMNARSKDSPVHMSPGPQEVQEELVKYIYDSWNTVYQEHQQKGSSAVAFYGSDNCPLPEGFVPFDLEAHWGKRLVQNRTTQNIPTQNM